MNQFVGTFAALLTVPGFYLYLRGVFGGTIKPHAFSWLVWSSLNAIAFSAQISEGAGAGAYVSLVVALGTFAVFIASLSRGERNIVLFDWACLAGAAFAGLAWLITDSPLLSVILVTIIDAFGCLPTFRKAYVRPWQEGVLLYALDAMAFVLAIVAMEKISVETALFPVFVVIADSSLVALILVRRRKVELVS